MNEHNLSLFDGTNLSKKETILFKNKDEFDEFLYGQHRWWSFRVNEKYITDSFIIELDYNQALGFDYVAFTRKTSKGEPLKTYYFVKSIEQLNEHVVKFNVELDTIATFNWFEILSGKLVRETTLNNVDFQQHLPEFSRDYEHHNVFGVSQIRDNIVPLVAKVALDDKEKRKQVRLQEGHTILPFSIYMTFVDVDDLDRKFFMSVWNEDKGRYEEHYLPNYNSFMDNFENNENLIDISILPFHDVMPSRLVKRSGGRDELVFERASSVFNDVVLREHSSYTTPVLRKNNISIRELATPGEVIPALMDKAIQLLYVTYPKTYEVNERPFGNYLTNNTSLKDGYVVVGKNIYPIFSNDMKVDDTSTSKVEFRTGIRFRDVPYIVIDTNIMDESRGIYVNVEHPLNSSITNVDTSLRENIKRAELQAMLTGAGSVISLMSGVANPILAAGASSSLMSLSYNTTETIRQLRKEMSNVLSDVIDISSERLAELRPRFVVSKPKSFENKIARLIYNGAIMEKDVINYHLYLEPDFGVKYVQFTDVIVGGDFPTIYKEDIEERLINGVRFWRKGDFLKFKKVYIDEYNKIIPI